MTIPFLEYFKKKDVQEKAVAAPAVMSAPVEKPSNERMSKTVMPNATRTVGPGETFAGTSVAPTGPAAGRHSISFGSSHGGRSAGLPPAVALALAPKVERTVSLELSEVIRKMPEGMVRPLDAADGTRPVLLKASELERGMASGKPSVSVATIYQQVPGIFVRTIEPSDDTQVELPFDKVLEQFAKLQVRSDQNREQSLPQMETPFLKVTLEDDARFGTVTVTAPAVTDDLPPVRVELATAETLAAAEPEARAHEKFVIGSSPSLQFPLPNGAGNGNGTRSTPAEKPSSSPARIPFKFSPKGTDTPAPERVPASGGPSVPNSSPARIPFKMTAPCEDVRPKAEPWLTKENFSDGEAPAEIAVSEPSAVAEEEGEPKVALVLRPILQSLLPAQLTGDVGGVPEDAQILIPLSLLESQLKTGRITLPPGEFARHIPEEHRGLFNAKETEAVVLPLQEVLKNLPDVALRMRENQFEQEKGGNFVTPFSTKAEEDAKRFKVAPTPVAKAKAPPKAAPRGAPKTPAAAAPIAAPAAEPQPVLPVEAGSSPDARSVLQTALDTDEELNAKKVVENVSKMPGVKACAIMFGDGLALAGKLPAEYEADGLCAIAPSFFRRLEEHMTEAKLGGLRSMTLVCDQAAMTFFSHDNLCLAVVHQKEELSSDIRGRLARVLLEVSSKYSHPV